VTIRSIYGEFGKKVRDGRRARGVTQDTLAREVGLSRTSITNIELGQQAALLHQVYDIARALGVAVETLLPADDRAVALVPPSVDDAAPAAVRRFLNEELSANARQPTRRER